MMRCRRYSNRVVLGRCNGQIANGRGCESPLGRAKGMKKERPLHQQRRSVVAIRS